jgi:predicted  nucleic acid-binding Zn-ribbon protein
MVSPAVSMTSAIRRCYKCGKIWDEEKARPGFRDTCDNCGAYLHCCLNCALYDPTAHNQCRSSTTESIRDRETVNYCDEFTFKSDTAKENAPKDSENVDDDWTEFLKKNR